MGLIATVGISPSYAYWDKTEYPAIQGTIPLENEEVDSSLAQITLVDAMTIAENEISDSKSMYGKLVSINGYLVYKIVVSNDEHDYKKLLVDAGSGEVLYVTDFQSPSTAASPSTTSGWRLDRSSVSPTSIERS